MWGMLFHLPSMKYYPINCETWAREEACTMYTALLSGFYILLSNYTAQNDIIVGTPIANRHYSDIQDLIGFFVNMQVSRASIDQEANLIRFISEVQNNLIEAQKHQDIPL